jgi:hypothetical protein
MERGIRRMNMKTLRRTKKQITVDSLLENSTLIDKNELENMKVILERERIEKLLKKLKK